MNRNIVIAKLVDDTRFAFRTKPLYQYDYGQVLKFEGVELPTVYEVHFSNTDQAGTAKAQIGNADGVQIPDEYLLTGRPVYVWVFINTGTEDGETEYKCIIPVNKRAQKEDAEPTPVEQDIITQAIAALNTAVESTSADAESAMSSAAAAAASEQNAAGSASLAMQSKQAAATSETNARKSEQNASASEEAAGRSQVAAATSASEALESQEAAAASASEALKSQRAAASSAEAALESQTAAAASESNAAKSEHNAGESEATAVQAAETATEKAEEADTSAAAAEASRQAIENLLVLAETLEPGEQATVTKTVDEHGTVTLTFGIPEGIPGGAFYS